MKKLLFIMVISIAAIAFADSTVIQPFTYGFPVTFNVDLTPNMPIPLPWGRNTKILQITVPEGQRISIDGAEVTGTVRYPDITQTLSVTVFDADRVTISVEETQ